MPRTTAEINKAVEAIGGAISVIGENGKEYIKLVEGTAQVFQTVEDSGAFNALVKMYEGGAINSFNSGSFRTKEGGSLFNSGAVGSRDRDFNITINAGFGTDTEALTRAVEDAMNQSGYRGTTTNRDTGLYIE